MTQEIKQTLSKLYEMTSKFNEIAGTNKEIGIKAITLQAKLVLEEAEELRCHLFTGNSGSINSKRLNKNELTLLLDDCMDVLVTTFGFIQKLEALGVDVGEAMLKTGRNNLSKYPTSPVVAYKTIEMYEDKGVKVNKTFNINDNCYVIRDESGKVRKPFGFVSNNLSNCVPDIIVE